MAQKPSRQTAIPRSWLAHALAAWRRKPAPAAPVESPRPLSRAEACLLLNELRSLEQNQRAAGPEADSASLRAALYS